MKRLQSLVPGDPRRNGAGRKGPMPSKMLSDMLKVYRNPASKDVTESQKKSRQWYDGDLKGFFMQLAHLERTIEQKKERSLMPANSSGSTESEPDIGTEKAKELIQTLLTEWRSQEAHDAES